MLESTERTRIITSQNVLSPTTTLLKDPAISPLNSSPLRLQTPSAVETIQDLFPEQEHEEKAIKKVKEILGPLAKDFTGDELRDLVAQIEYLVETWLDEFERDIFKGMTLKELLHERGGL